jgi:hypothetical protein
VVNINTEGMEVAPLADEQLHSLMEAEKRINNSGDKSGEIYLLAVTRRS